MSDLSDSSDSNSEALDPTVVGQHVGDDTIPGLDPDFPPEQPLGVDDPNITHDGSIAPDDAETREDRTNPEVGEMPQVDADDGRDDIGGLAEPTDASESRDTDRKLIADEVTGTERGAEADALHVERASDA